MDRPKGLSLLKPCPYNSDPERGKKIIVRLRFQKKGTLRFISHHDLMRLLERALRRAELPIKMTQGFNPRLRMSFPLALALGIEGHERKSTRLNSSHTQISY